MPTTEEARHSIAAQVAEHTDPMFAELDAQVVSDDGYTRGDLRVAFDMVADKDDWKAPVDALIHPTYREVVREAVIFFTGSVPSFVARDGRLRVHAAGYYEVCGI